jgi:hypothetical protein
MTVIKIDDTLCPVREQINTGHIYVDYNGQATAASNIDELLQRLRELYKQVEVVRH